MSVVDKSKPEVLYWRIPASGLRIRIGPTPYGLGVFAYDPIPAGAELGEILGTIIEDVDYESDYCMDFGESMSLEPEAPYRFVNHSCEPNCELCEIDFEDEEGGFRPVLILVALGDIRPGEQLTIDYAWPAEEAIPCGCAAVTCRGYIVCRDEVVLAQKLHDRF